MYIFTQVVFGLSARLQPICDDSTDLQRNWSGYRCFLFRSGIKIVNWTNDLNAQFDHKSFQQIHHIDFTLSSVIVALLIFVLNLFIYCYFGELATGSFEKMSDSLDDIDWYELPIELQRYFILMKANMQKPLHYHGFGVANLSLNTFITVRKI